MNLSTIISIVAILLGYAGAVVSLYVNLRIKLKALDLKILEIEKNLLEFKNLSQNTMEKLDIKNSTEHNVILNKLDKLLDKLIELKLDSNDRINKISERLEHIKE